MIIHGSPSTIAVVLKTNEGGIWVIAQVLEAIRRGHQVVVMIPDGAGRLRRRLDNLAVDETLLSVRPLTYDFTFKPNLRTMRGLLEIRHALRTVRADAVLYHLYASALAVRIATVGRRRLRRVHMVAGPLYLENRLIRMIERVLWRRDSFIIAGSEYTRTLYRQLGVPGNRIASIPYGVDISKFSPESHARKAARKQFDISPDDFVVVMVAYVYAPKSLVFPGVGIKGHELLLEAWRTFAAERDDVRLIFVGSGFGEEGETHREKLKAAVVGTAVAGSVEWISSVDDVRAVYSAADISVSPSLSDNHGAVLEASAMSVPSIVSDAGALPEGIDRRSGWVFETGDARALARQLDVAYRSWRDGLLPDRGRIARQNMVDHFSSSDCVARVIDIVEERNS
ncbi:glycosyltransferase family 4 protein [Microbacterium azadirachtae]|uniref:glycosyltransferase family 4 protein n=1 Tax=Microbacterium azadirachtae TaxID=582680 RepID=UPI003F75035F